MNNSVKDILTLFYKQFVWITLCTLGGLLIGLFLVRNIIKPSYTSSVQMYVNSSDKAYYGDLSELDYAQRIVTTYINFLQTKVFYSEVLEKSKLDYTLEQLTTMTNINSVNATEIFKISVTTHRPGDSYQLAMIMQEVAPNLIKSIKADAQISIVDPVTYPLRPSGPNTILYTATGGLVGLLLSLSYLFLKELIDVKVKSPEELKRRYPQPILGEIPEYSIDKFRSFRFSFNNLRVHKKKDRPGILLVDPTDFVLSEAYKALRINLRYTAVKDGCKKLLINSPLSREGKSTVCANIGITIARSGARVLLIDCDMRKGCLHRFFNLTNYPGTSDILSGMIQEQDAVNSTSYENLKVIPMGTLPPNQAELLAGTRFEELLKFFEKDYDFILLDSPPVTVVSDALSMSKLVDGALLVVREGCTTYPDISRAISKYEYVGGTILGFVYNGSSYARGKGAKSKYNYYSNC